MKTVRRFLLALTVAVCSVLVSSCEHRKLTDSSGRHYVRVYLDEHIRNVTYGFYNESYERPDYSSPVIFRVVLASPESGKVMYETLLRNHGHDERGEYVDGYMRATGGYFDMLVYQMGSSVTRIRNQNNYREMTAYTETVDDRMLGYLPELGKEFGDGTIMREPEHLLRDACEMVYVPMSMSEDTLRNSTGDYFTASTIVKSYYLQLRIKGVEWVHAAAAVLTGMAGSDRMCMKEGMTVEEPVNLFFNMNYADKQMRAGEDVSTAVLYTTFSTFGKMPEEQSLLSINFEFTKTDGSTQVETIDITEMFDTPMAIENQWILLDKEIIITRPEGTGGLTPGVEGWKDVETDVLM